MAFPFKSSPLPTDDSSEYTHDSSPGRTSAANRCLTIASPEEEAPMANGKPQLTLRTRWLFWRARLSTPALLACRNERQVLARVTPISAAVVILTISLFAWLTDLPLVFPALGPSTFILFTTPLSPAGAPRSVVLGHLSCLCCGAFAYHTVTLLTGQPVSIDHVGAPLVLSAVLALALATWSLVKLNCPHPPACASSLVVALGGLTDPVDLFLTAVVIVWLAAEAVIVNRLAGLPVPLWRPRQGPPVDLPPEPPSLQPG